MPTQSTAARCAGPDGPQHCRSVRFDREACTEGGIRPKNWGRANDVNRTIARTGSSSPVVLLLIVLLSACAADAKPRVLIASAPDIGALAARDNTLLYAERLTGRVRSVSLDETAIDSGELVVSELPVSNDGQRGLVGLAVDARGRLFGSWTAATGDRRMMVGQLEPGPVSVVWTGPPSTDIASGGRIAFSPGDESLVVGIGDLLDGAKVDDPAALNGKLLALDPDGPADQSPRVVSSGWHNPFAFVFRGDGSLWVADNSPGEMERLARVGTDGRPTASIDIGDHSAPAGLAAVGERMYVCSYADGLLRSYPVEDGRPTRGDVLARDCSTAVIETDQGLVYASRNGISSIDVTV